MTYLPPWVSTRAARKERGDAAARHPDDEPCAFVGANGSLCPIARHDGRRWCAIHAAGYDEEARAQGGAIVLDLGGFRCA